MRRDGNNAKHGSNEKHDSYSSHASHNSHPILPPRGDYKTLLSHQKAEVVYDITFRFAHKFLSKGDRTIDQMIQAARSGKQNIVEGSKTPQTHEDYREFIETRPPEGVANIALCLIHQTNYLLDQQLTRLEKDFLDQGGLRERMTQARIAHRSASRSSASPET